MLSPHNWGLSGGEVGDLSPEFLLQKELLSLRPLFYTDNRKVLFITEPLLLAKILGLLNLKQLP